MMTEMRRETASRTTWPRLILGVAVATATGLAWFWSHPPSTAQAAEVPTATVTKAAVTETLRVTGVTAALETFRVVAPQLNGSRGNRGRTAVAASAAAASAAVSAQNTQKSGSGSGSSSPASALKAATSRVSGLASSQAAPAKSATTTGTPATGANGSLGSTAGALVNYSQPDRRGDFDLILQYLAPSGSMVKRGDILAKFDAELMGQRAEDYQDSLKQAEEGVNILKANLEVTRKAYQQSLDAARAAVEKAQLDLKTLPVLGRLDAERLQLQSEEAKARYEEVLKERTFRERSEASQLKQAELDLAQAKLELERVQRNIDQLTVKAPVDGMVVVRQTWVRGEIRRYRIGDQMRPGQNFMDVVSGGSMVVNARLNQVDVQRLRVGQKAVVRFDAYAGLTMPAHLEKVGSLASGDDRETYVTVIPMQLVLDAADPRVIPDLTASADVVINASEPMSVIPLTAVQREGTSDYVWLRQGESWVKRMVTLGMADHVKVAVRTGLREGDVVALRPPATTGSEVAR